MSRRISFVIVALTVTVLTAYQPVSSQRAQSFNGFDLVDKEGNIRKPTDYREHFELLGTYTVHGEFILERDPNRMGIRSPALSRVRGNLSLVF